MKFSQFDYKRPSIEVIRLQFEELIDDFNKADTVRRQEEIILKINSIRIEFESMMNIAFIRYSINTADVNNEKEQDYFDEISPEYRELVSKFYQSLDASPHKSGLIKRFGSQLFDVARSVVKTISPNIVNDLKKENHLSNRYMKLKASAKINFNNSDLSLPELEPFMESQDREIRHGAFNAYWGFFASKADELDNIFDNLVKLRTNMAKVLGYENFIGLGYARMRRIDYDAEMVDKFRQKIKKYVVPVITKLRQRQAKRIGLDNLKVYDLFLMFKSGNANPKGNPEWIVAQGEKMYKELSPQTGEFFDFMTNNELMDLYSRKGKADMGYCEYIPKYHSPFIFANMNKTDDDITVLTHEAGHAFQSYMSRHFELKEYTEPTMESAEIHSMSMEFITWKWMDYFFGKDSEKFRFSHLSNALSFLPYGVLVDDFQHWVYANPDASPSERKSKWREMEKEYMPHLDYDGNEFLESGGRWQKQGHIYEMPFYYIDYALAQICALQFRSKIETNFDQTLNDYIKLCKAGGSKPFLQLVELAGLKSPFDDNVIESCVEASEKWLDEIDDSKF
ncbi:M3 family oligoendopeptidase [Ignavibacteria bacterium CHB1]|nr:MAG: M3 family oligoendopeptidase [Chlorobiota bacterium]MBV6397803.1 hypothetical protein [Ignavibacteria bacterium]MCC6885580.1 M3 family oligoendopeptidase [Ignavibacteriales bacterium]MCE7952934.1 M3 family oligoendopeptidase [Chlorobi bacterium CHB7]MDL1886903.1 M3 family oligoendopeptidase [Ignavibacteria bacterium CHB1]RIK49689.1 MAG: M3 family oligoendopeptidase [Ignavibacteriota bacterium]